MIDSKTRVEKTYAGLLGKVIGVRLGAPVEPTFWNDKRIEQVYGEISGYIKEYTHFAADDDINGPIIFVRAVEDAFLKSGRLTPEDIGDAWLNYTAEGHGMFWWGGYGTSTEHTAFENMQKGIRPPRSGSIQKNGHTIAEQIGGQIFIDCWGLICPENPKKATELAMMAASVSHDRNALFGAGFVAVCISLAFVEERIEKIVDQAIRLLPQNCEYAIMARDVQRVFHQHPDDWKKTWQYVREAYNHQKYPGVVHIIPNGAIVVLSLLHSRGDFSKSICIATMCGLDTDCNAGNVGTIMGVLKGVEGIDGAWRKPIADFVAASSVVGSLNIVDLPTMAHYLSALGLAMEKVDSLSTGDPREWKKIRLALPKSTDIQFDFSLPGSTHSLHAYPNHIVALIPSESNESKGFNHLAFRVNFARRNTAFRLFFKPFWSRKEFDDERYIPNFSPVVYPGQVLTTSLYTDSLQQNQDLFVQGYVQDTTGQQWVEKQVFQLTNGQWLDIQYTIPSPLDGAMIEEVGLLVTNSGREPFYGSIHMSNFMINGPCHFSIDPLKQKIEFGTVTPFTFHKGHWSLADDQIQGVCSDEANLYTGHLYWKNYSFQSRIRVAHGTNAKILFRAQGNLRYYSFGFALGGVDVQCINRSFSSAEPTRSLSFVPFSWKPNHPYTLKVLIQGNRMVMGIDEQTLFELEDDSFDHGMVGYRIESGSRILIETFEIKEYTDEEL